MLVDIEKEKSLLKSRVGSDFECTNPSKWTHPTPQDFPTHPSSAYQILFSPSNYSLQL